MRIHKLLTTFCIFWFILLCLLNYFSPRPLWLDENLILENIKSLNYQEILGPLKNSQAFPRFYLILIKYVSSHFDYNKFFLRLLPLISMLLAFFVWRKIYKEEFKQRWNYFLALFSFVSSYYLTYYASELKPYSMDILVAGIFLLYLSQQKKYIDKRPAGSFVIATFLLPLTIFFSYISFLFFWAVSYNFLFFLKKTPRALFSLIVYTLMCFIIIVWVSFGDLRHTVSTPALFSYWKDYFLCTDSFYCFMKALGEGLRRISVWWFGNNDFLRRAASFLIPFFIFSLFGYGAKALKENKFKLYGADALGLIIFLELFILGIIKKYPFTGERITLFFSPFVFYSIVKGISFLRKNTTVYLGVNILYVTFLMMCSINSFLMYFRLYY